MIRAIVAIDEKRGLADEAGIPWLGKVPSDHRYYRDQIRNADVIMGYGMYLEMKQPYPNCKNYVATSRTGETLRAGFTAVYDAREFIKSYASDIWNMGGAGLFTSTLDLNDELYITQLKGDFGCTKFFPVFFNDFQLVYETDPVTENNITFTFQKWVKK